MPSKREALTVTVIMALFLLLTSIFIGLRSEHLLMAVLYLVLFFAGLPTRKLAVDDYRLRNQLYPVNVCYNLYLAFERETQADADQLVRT